MNIIINHSSSQPIYDQIVSQVRQAIIGGRITADSVLPSVRTLSSRLMVSALTVKKAYDILEKSGWIVTVHGKGSYVSPVNQQVFFEERQKEFENQLSCAIHMGRKNGMTKEEMIQLFHILLED